MQRPFTTAELAELLHVDVWRIQRLFERGVLEEPPRFGGRRVIAPELVPQIVDALRDRGWLPTEAPVDQADQPEALPT